MYWEAKLIDGREIREIEGSQYGSYSDQISALKLYETPSNFGVVYDSNLGIMRFNNLNLQKLDKVPEIKMVYDKEGHFFRMSDESKEFFLDSMIKDEKEYLYFGINEDNSLYVKSQIIPIDIKTIDSKSIMENLLDRRIIYYLTGHSDLLTSSTQGPIKKKSVQDEAHIGSECVYRIRDDIELKITSKLIFDFDTRYMKYSMNMRSSKEIELIFEINDQKFKISPNHQNDLILEMGLMMIND